MILSRIKNLFPIALFLVIGACSNTEEEASKALRELSNQFEAASLWNFRAPRPGLMDEIEVDLALNAVIEIRAKLDTIAAKFPETTAVKEVLSKDPYSDGLSIQKIDAQIKYLQREKLLFQHRSEVLSERGDRSPGSAFGFSFTEKSDTTCQDKSIDMYSVRNYLPRLQDGNLNHFLIKFDNIIDLLIAIEDSTNDAFNSLDTRQRDELGIESWKYADNKSKLIYDNMLRLFANGYVPDYLENPAGIEIVPAMTKLGELSNKSMVRCSSKDNEEEFKTRVGNWLPPDGTYYLDAIGSETSQFPVYVLLHSFASKSDKAELTDPLIAGLNKKYGDAIAEDRSIDFLQQSWITAESVLIVLRFHGDRDPLSYLARFSLSYIYLPAFMERYQEFLEAYLVSYKHIVDSMRERDRREEDLRADEINTKL